MVVTTRMNGKLKCSTSPQNSRLALPSKACTAARVEMPETPLFRDSGPIEYQRREHGQAMRFSKADGVGQAVEHSGKWPDVSEMTQQVQQERRSTRHE